MTRALLTLLVLLTLAGCGETSDLADRAGDRFREQRARFQEELREQEERLRSRVEEIRARIEEVLGQLERAVPRADRTSPEVRARGRQGAQTIDEFLSGILDNIDRYWTRTLAANDLPEPRVAYYWVPPGGAVMTACGAPADDNAAFYCPADDTIYVAQRFAAALYQGALRGLPGEAAGGHARGDFGVAYLVAHEYAHNLQQELGIFTVGDGTAAKPFELQADCMAGAWGSSAFESGRYNAEDIEEAVGTALAVGDFDLSSAGHHGTPQERRAAWLTGFETGDPSSCRRYVPGT